MRAPGEGRRPKGTAALVLAAALAVALVLGLVASACGADARASGDVRGAAGPATMDEAPVATAPPPAPTTTVPPAPPPPLPVAARVLTVGDSGMVDADAALEPAFLAAGAVHVERGGVMGFGLTRGRPGEPPWWRTKWPEVVRDVDPDLTIAMLGGWDAHWIDQHGPDAYRQLLVEATQVLTAGGGRVLWLSVLPGRDDPHEDLLDDLLDDVPALFPGAAFYVDTAPALSGPAGDFPTSYVGPDGRPVLLRKDDGWHLCQDGAARLARWVNDWAVALRLASPAPVGWERGPWWDDVAFESPACWPKWAWAT